MSLVRLRGLTITYPGVAALRGVDFDVEPGQRWAIVGQSGSGKSTLGRALLGSFDGAEVTSTQFTVTGIDIQHADAAMLRRLRGGAVAMVMQDSLGALNPMQTIGAALLECQAAHGHAATKTSVDRALAALQAVDLDDPQGVMSSYPHELSGGQRQRACIAVATVTEPVLLVADEPTSALDPPLARTVCRVLARCSADREMSLIVITHDLDVAVATCDRVAVLDDGQIVERGDLAQVIAAPASDAMKKLIAACALSVETDAGGV